MVARRRPQLRKSFQCLFTQEARERLWSPFRLMLGKELRTMNQASRACGLGPGAFSILEFPSSPACLKDQVGTQAPPLGPSSKPMLSPVLSPEPLRFFLPALVSVFPNPLLSLQKCLSHTTTRVMFWHMQGQARSLPGLKNPPSRAGEMTQWLKCLLHKCEVRTGVPRSPESR